MKFVLTWWKLICFYNTYVSKNTFGGPWPVANRCAADGKLIFIDGKNISDSF